MDSIDGLTVVLAGSSSSSSLVDEHIVILLHVYVATALCVRLSEVNWVGIKYRPDQTSVSC